MPPFFEDSDLIAVHGGLLNGIPLPEQPVEVVDRRKKPAK